MEVVPEDEDLEEEDEEARRARLLAKAAPENVATPWTVTAPGVHSSRIGSRVNVKRLAVIALAAVLVLVGLRAVLPKPAPPESVAIQFTQGSQTRYRVFVTYKGTRTLPSGKSFPLSMNLHATIDLSVASVEGDVATVDVKTSNAYASGPSPFVRQVPREFQTQIQVGKDGTIRSGQLGLANAMIGYLIPGWDLLFPMLPQDAVNEGDSWNGSEQVPVTEAVQVSVTATSTLLGVLDTGAGRISIVTSKVAAPVKADVALADVAASIGVDASDYGLPEGANPTLSFDGTVAMDLTARIDAAAGIVTNMYMKGSADYAVTAKGVPGLDKKNSSGQVTVNMSVRISKQTIPTPSPSQPSPEADKEQ